MENIVDFIKCKQNRSITDISGFGKITYDNLQESIRTYRSIMEEEDMLAYAKSVTDLETKEYMQALRQPRTGKNRYVQGKQRYKCIECGKSYYQTSSMIAGRTILLV